MQVSVSKFFRLFVNELLVIKSSLVFVGLNICLCIGSLTSLAAQHNDIPTQISLLEIKVLDANNLDSLSSSLSNALTQESDQLKKARLNLFLAIVEFKKGLIVQSENRLSELVDKPEKLDLYHLSKAILWFNYALYESQNYEEINPMVEQWYKVANPSQQDYELDRSIITTIDGLATSWNLNDKKSRFRAKELYEKGFDIIDSIPKLDARYVSQYSEAAKHHCQYLSVSGQEVEAIRVITPVIAYLRDEQAYDTEKLLDHYHNYGLAYTRIGDFEKANIYFDKCIEYVEANRENICEHNYAIKLLHKILVSLWSGNYQQGVDIGIKKLLPANCLDRYGVAMSHNNIAHCYVEMMRYDSALYHLNEAIKYASEPDTSYYFIGIPTRTKGFLFNYFAEYEKAREAAYEGWEYFKKIDHKKEFINCQAILGKAYLGLGQLDSSQYYLENTLDLLGFDRIDNYNNSPRNFGVEIVRSLIDYADLHDSLFLRNRNEQYLLKSNSVLNDVFEVIDYRISNINSDESVIAFLNIFNGLTEKCIQSDLRLFDLTGEEKYFFAGLNKADRHKSKLAIRNNLLMDRNLFADGSESIHENWKLYNEENRKIFNKLLTEKDSTAVKELKERQFLVKDKIDKLESELKENNTIYDAYVADLDYNEYRKKLGKDELDLLFFEGQEELFCFYISAEKTAFKMIPWTQADKESIVEISGRGGLQIDDPAINNLSRSLDPIMDEVSNYPSIKYLSIVPDGVLNLVPFELLSYRGTTLINSYICSYASSLRLKSNNNRATKGKGLACFVPSYDRSINNYDSDNDKNIYAALVRSGEYELPGAKAESEDIIGIYGGKEYIGKEAAESNFREVATDYSILHLAMHAYGDNTTPLNSKLVFTQDSKNGDEEDNYLHMHELVNLPVSADMVVLSACSTGTGKIEKGEGVLSLSKAFTAAGAASVVHSLWKVPDQATSRIMVDFYKNLKQGKRKDESLHLAKLAYLNDETIPLSQKTPYHWAGFVVTGDMSPIESSNIALWFWVAVAILLFGVLLLLTRKVAASRKS